MFIAAVLPILLLAPISNNILQHFDYPVHRELAWNFTWPAHFLYHALLTIFRSISGDWLLAQKLLLFVNYGILGITLYVFLAFTIKTKRNLPGLGLLAASLIFVYPIPAIYPWDNQLYYGYIALNVYHNTTSLILKPILVLHLLWLYLWLSGENKSTKWFILTGAVLVILSALAKPSYLIVLLPALFLLVIRDRGLWRVALLANFLPGTLVLAWLFLMTFGGTSGGLAFAPLKVMTHFTELWTILPKTTLSLLFPLTTLAVLHRQVLNDRLVILCWLMVFFSLAFALLLSETGERVFDGNWLWSSQLSGFALFTVSLRLLLNLNRKLVSGWRLTLAWGAFAAHVLAGLAWYLVQYEPNPFLYW